MNKSSARLSNGSSARLSNRSSGKSRNRSSANLDDNNNQMISEFYLHLRHPKFDESISSDTRKKFPSTLVVATSLLIDGPFFEFLNGDRYPQKHIHYRNLIDKNSDFKTKKSLKCKISNEQYATYFDENKNFCFNGTVLPEIERIDQNSSIITNNSVNNSRFNLVNNSRSNLVNSNQASSSSDSYEQWISRSVNYQTLIRFKKAINFKFNRSMRLMDYVDRKIQNMQRILPNLRTEDLMAFIIAELDEDEKMIKHFSNGLPSTIESFINELTFIFLDQESY